MIDVNSNCSRVDAVKAAATQIKLQSGAANRTDPAAARASAAATGAVDDPSRKVKSDLQTLDTQIKANDAKKAELALAVTKKDIDAAQTATDQTSPGRQPFRGLNVYA